MTIIHPMLSKVTNDIIQRSAITRKHYLDRMRSSYGKIVSRSNLSCTNLAHIMAAEDSTTKFILKELERPNIGIISAYNDVLSAHQPYYRYPEKIKEYALKYNGTVQMAGGVPAMCDGVTQGQTGMELSLFSRDVIAMSTAIGLSHNIFDAVTYLGICDKIVPGLLIGALSFGHLPAVFIPSGPMKSGISNKEKADTRKLFAEGSVTPKQLLESEMKSYNSPGTCTFYGTANTNQMFMEIMGLHIPGSAFVSPNTPLRDALTECAVKRTIEITHLTPNFTPLCEIITEKTIVNGIVGLLATGGSTNHTIHLPAIAKACGIIINWDDFAQLSEIVPLITKIYPNGEADINDFHNAGGMACVIHELLHSGLLHNNVKTIVGDGLRPYTKNPMLSDDGKLVWQNGINTNTNIIKSVSSPFAQNGGLKILTGNLGRAVSKISAIAKEHYYVKAPARVFTNQDDIKKAFNDNKLNMDCVIILQYQGGKSNGMPELHGLTPLLSSLQDKGYKVGLVTDGRMSGASGKVPHAIHITPDAINNGNIAKIRDNDIIELDLINSTLKLLISNTELEQREIVTPNLTHNHEGMGRELFAHFRNNVSSSELGASIY